MSNPVNFNNSYIATSTYTALQTPFPSQPTTPVNNLFPRRGASVIDISNCGSDPENPLLQQAYQVYTLAQAEPWTAQLEIGSLLNLQVTYSDNGVSRLEPAITPFSTAAVAPPLQGPSSSGMVSYSANTFSNFSSGSLQAATQPIEEALAKMSLFSQQSNQ